MGDPFPGLPSVVADDRNGGEMQAAHLAAKGHRHVLYLLARQPVGSALARMESFVASAKGLGIRTTVRYKETYARPLDASDFTPVLRDADRATAVVGFDGFRNLYPTRFDITSVRAPWFEVGRLAVDRLAALVRGEDVPLLTTLPVAFVPGSTT